MMNASSGRQSFSTPKLTFFSRLQPQNACSVRSLRPSSLNASHPTQRLIRCAAVTAGDGTPSFFRNFSLPIPSLSRDAEPPELLVSKEDSQPASAVSSSRPVVSLAGGGIFFFWELGVLDYLVSHYDLSKVTFIGASAGALCSVLIACGVDATLAVREAYRLAVENDIFARPGGLSGIWGGIIRQWLDEILPANAHERCKGRVKIIVTEIPSLRLRYLENFDSREDLIEILMASIHIPFFMNGKATFKYQGQTYVDGSLYDFITGQNSDLLQCNGEACIIDYFFDDKLEFNRLDFIKISSYDGVKGLMQSGYDYADRKFKAGEFRELESVKKSTVRRAIEYPFYALSTQINKLLKP